MGSFEFSELWKSFRAGSPALRDLSFRYEGAGAVGCVGPNGAGKTTALKLLVGLLRPSKGHAFVNGIESFNRTTEAAYLDFLARARADVAIPVLLDTCQHRGVGIPAPPQGADPDPLIHLLSGAGPGHDEIRARSFYGLLELPGYSDAKLTHIYGDSRMIRTALDAAWPWLKAVREDERRSLQILWSDDAIGLRRRVGALVDFLTRLNPANDALTRAQLIQAQLESGRFAILQSSARLYATYGRDAEIKFDGRAEKEVETMKKEVASLSAVLREFPDPAKVDAGDVS
jgi:energy-coupling factor transporter ATP-binding protein EcfA2